MNMQKYGLAGGALLVVMALVLIAGPLAAIAQGSPIGATIGDLETIPPDQREVDQPRRIGQAWVDKIAVTDPEVSHWQGAHLTSPQPYHNPKGEVIAYMFAIEKNEKAVGHVLVGSSAYGYPIFAAGQGPPSSIPTRSEVSSILTKEHGLQVAEEGVGEPTLLLLNILRGFYAVWEVEGQVAGVNLVTGDSFVAPRLEEIRSSMPSPQDYRAAKTATTQSRRGMALQGANWGSGEIPHADQMRGDWPDPNVSGIPSETRRWWCGPSAATTIALWKRDFDGDSGFPQPPVPPDPPWQATVDIFDGFDHHNMCEVTMWWNWLWGFLGYAESPGVDEHFDLEWRNTYWEIVHEIDNDWPMGLMGIMTGPPGTTKDAHWVAVKEYFWIGGSDYLIIVADTWWAGSCNVTANRRFLCWDALDGTWLGTWVWSVRDTD
ncbi:hypothetical protein M1O56_03140 [Dehalococcoidia bacterium]|nr:hypothetical protein [Dehalococcoidia bacterium]